MKRIIAIALSAVLLISVAVAGTLALVSDEERTVNVYTSGDIDIALVNNTKDSVTLFPAVYDLSLDAEDVWKTNTDGLWENIENVQEKYVAVKNEGKNDAYIRVIVAFENPKLPGGGYFVDKLMINDTETQGNTDVERLELPNVQIGGKNYALYAYTYTKALKGGQTSAPALLQVALNMNTTSAEMATIGESYEILACAQAVQYSNVNDAKSMLKAAFGDIENGVHPWSETTIAYASNETELRAALPEGGIVVLTSDIDVDADSTITIAAGKDATLVLGGHTITGVSDGTKNRELFLVKGNLTVTGNGTVSMEHKGANMGWNYMTTVFDVTGGGQLNVLDGAKIVNLGGTDMNYCVHLNNWGEVTLVADHVTFEAPYCAIRVFNSGYDMNTVKVTNSTIHSGNRALWVHNYIGDLDSSKHSDDAIKARLNIDVLNGTNTIVGKVRYGFNNSVDLYKTIEIEEGATSAENGAALADAINATTEHTYLSLPAGEYRMPSVSAEKEVTIVGTKDTVIDIAWGAYMDSSKVSFEGVTIKGSTGYVTSNGTNFGSDYAALYTPNVTYTNCTFDGPFRVGRDGATFINCTFTNLGNDYVWTYGNDVTFKNCTFESEGKALLIYSDGGNEVAKVVVENCVFNATQGRTAWAIANQNCAAIEIDNTGNGVDLVLSGNTVNNTEYFSGEWRIKSYNSAKPDVIVNGVEYTTTTLDGETLVVVDRNVQ